MACAGSKLFAGGVLNSTPLRPFEPARATCLPPSCSAHPSSSLTQRGRSGLPNLSRSPGLGFKSVSGRPSRRCTALRAVLDPSQLDSAASLSIHAAATAQNFLASLADAAVAVEAVKEDGGWFGGLADLLEVVLKFLEQRLQALHVPYAYGFSIILLTVLVKALTFPLTKKQVESTLAMQALQPKLKSIQTKFAGDQERIQLETARLYRNAGVNPLAGCLPTLATLPVWIGLYQALSNVAKEGVLTEGFFWIPSLAGPASLDARDSGSGLSWLFNWTSGVPPLGWGQTAAYLVLPVLLVASQYYSMQILQPQQVSDDPAQKNTQLILKFLPIMIGWFALSVPSGLSLYWFTNNVLSTAQTVYLRQMGGATPAITAEQATEIIDVGQAKRSGANLATEDDRERAERFKRLKEMEDERRAARRAAEETARAAAVQAQQERAVLDTSAAAAATALSDAEEEEAEATHADDGKTLPTPPAAPSQVPAVAATAAAGAKPTSKRSKRSRRTQR